VYFFAGPLTDAFCHLRVWLLSLGFALIIGTMFVKTYRIWRIFCNKTLKRRQLSDRWLAFILVAFIVVDIGVLVVFSVVGNSTVESYPSPTNPAATIQSCRFNYIIFYSLFGYKGLLLLFTVFLCFMIWNVKPAMPDFTALSVSVFTFAVCGLILIPIMLIITEGDPNPTAVFLGPALATIVPIAITLAVVFVPKVKELHKNRNKQSDMEFNLQINTASTVTTVSKQTNVTDFDDPAENKSVIELLETIKQKDDQIERLKNILAKKKYKIRSLKQRLIEAKQNQDPPSRSNMQSSEHS
jgi:gamma-aminobutyric acid type B receptor